MFHCALLRAVLLLCVSSLVDAQDMMPPEPSPPPPVLWWHLPPPNPSPPPPGFTERSSGKEVAFPPAEIGQSSADSKEREADEEEATAAPPRTSDLEAPRTSLLDESRQRVLEDVELEMTDQLHQASARRSTVAGGRASLVGGDGAASKRASIAPTPITENEGAAAPTPASPPNTTGDSHLVSTIGSVRVSEREPPADRRPGERRGSIQATKVSSLKSSQV